MSPILTRTLEYKTHQCTRKSGYYGCNSGKWIAGADLAVFSWRIAVKPLRHCWRSHDFRIVRSWIIDVWNIFQPVFDLRYSQSDRSDVRPTNGEPQLRRFLDLRISMIRSEFQLIRQLIAISDDNACVDIKKLKFFKKFTPSLSLLSFLYT